MQPFNPRPAVPHTCLWCGRKLKESTTSATRPLNADERARWDLAVEVRQTSIERVHGQCDRGEISYEQRQRATQGIHRAFARAIVGPTNELRNAHTDAERAVCVVLTPTGKYGLHDRDHFDTLTCAALWAELAADRGVRFERATPETR